MFGENNPAKRLEVRKKISKARKKNPIGFIKDQSKSIKTRFKKGHIPWSKGKLSPWTSERNKLAKGEKSPVWLGGKSFEPYTTDWTKTLKKSIRQRDKYTCQICGEEPALYVHHIDYNKKNCNPNNLIILCHSCHSKTNYNRDYWINYFYENQNNYNFTS